MIEKKNRELIGSSAYNWSKKKPDNWSEVPLTTDRKKKPDNWLKSPAYNWSKKDNWKKNRQVMEKQATDRKTDNWSKNRQMIEKFRLQLIETKQTTYRKKKPDNWSKNTQLIEKSRLQLIEKRKLIEKFRLQLKKKQTTDRKVPLTTDRNKTDNWLKKKPDNWSKNRKLIEKNRQLIEKSRLQLIEKVTLTNEQKKNPEKWLKTSRWQLIEKQTTDQAQLIEKKLHLQPIRISNTTDDKKYLSYRMKQITDRIWSSNDTKIQAYNWLNINYTNKRSILTRKKE